MAIVSSARTAAIIEEVADKHGLEVRTMLCAAWRRDMVLARGEVAYRLRTELKLPWRAIGAKLGISHERGRQLFAGHKKREAQARLFAPVPDPEGRIRELEAELQRLSGTYLSEKLASQLNVPLRCAILLSILIEAYPRYVRGPALLQLYDDACEKLGYGARNGANFDLVTKHACDLAARFKESGWPAPSEIGELKGSRRLTDGAADWLSQHFGAPRRSVIEGVREAAESDSGSLAVRASGATFAA